MFETAKTVLHLLGSGVKYIYIHLHIAYWSLYVTMGRAPSGLPHEPLWDCQGPEFRRKTHDFTDLRILGGSQPGGGGVHADPRIKLPPVFLVLYDNAMQKQK